MAPVEIKLGSESIVANLESASDHSRMPHKHCRKLSDSFKCVYKCSILRSSVPMCEVSPATFSRGALRGSQRPLIFDHNFRASSPVASTMLALFALCTDCASSYSTQAEVFGVYRRIALSKAVCHPSSVGIVILLIGVA